MQGNKSQDPLAAGLVIRHKGAARTTYEIPNQFQPQGKDLLLVVADDKVSLFGFKLRAQINDKAEVMTALNVFWRRKLDEWGIEHDLVACGPEIDKYLPPNLRNNTRLHKRALVVKAVYKLQFECIFRNHIAGGAWRTFKKDGTAYGHYVDPNIRYGARLHDAIFTPKIRQGHVPIDFQSVIAILGTRPMDIGLRAYKLAYDYALSCGILIADSNIEIGALTDSDSLVVGGDLFVPDSSRYWDEDDYKESLLSGKHIDRFDKGPVAEYARMIGMDKYDPDNIYDQDRARALPISLEVCNMTTMIYSQIMIRLTKRDLISFQVQEMNIT